MIHQTAGGKGVLVTDQALGTEEKGRGCPKQGPPE